MSKHTPGPWVVMTNRAGYPYQIRAPHQSPHKPGGIVDITRWGSISMPSSPEGAANARLIAAAPDMLRALKSCIIAASPRELEDALHEAMDAALKAEGVP